PRLEPQQRRDGLQVVLHTVVNLADHRGLDLQLLFLAHLVGDVLDGDERPSRLGPRPAQAPPPAPARRLRQRYHPLDPDLVLLLDALLETRARLHRFEANVLVRVELGDLAVQQALGVAQAPVLVLRHGADVSNLPVTVYDDQPVVLANAPQPLAAAQSPFERRLANAGQRLAQHGILVAHPLVLEHV